MRLLIHHQKIGFISDNPDAYLEQLQRTVAVPTQAAAFSTQKQN
jgi:hypothetical protein